MKIILNISKIILIVFFLIFLSLIIVALNINNTYKNEKICRSNAYINISNYYDLSNVKTIELIENCDKIKIYILLDSTVTKDNINGIILQIEAKKKTYNDDDIFELFLENDNVKYLIIIDKNETIDIDYLK